MVLKVHVIGAGVNGFASAMCIAQQYPDCHVTITSADYQPQTTSNHGFGFVSLSSTNDDVDSIGFKHTKQTVEYCKQFGPKLSEETGIVLRPSVGVYENKTAKDKKSAKYYELTGVDVRLATEREVGELGFDLETMQRLFGEGIRRDDLSIYVGHHYIIDTGRYLMFLMKALSAFRHENGDGRVTFVRKQLTCLSELGSCDLIVNCSGLGAKDLVGDTNVTPIRGQYLSFVAHDQKKAILVTDKYFTVVVPRLNDVVVGGVHQTGRTDRTPDPQDTEDILRRAEVIFPSIRRAKIRKIDVGIRPGRIGGPRVELEVKRLSRNKEVPVIHNYGHGSYGISQHYGCAVTVCSLAGPYLSPKPKL